MLDSIIKTLCEHANWNTPLQKQNGEYCFLLDRDMELNLFSQNGQDFIFYVPLISIPADNTKENFFLDIARKAAGMFKKKRSIVSIRDNKVLVYRNLNKQDINDETVLTTTMELLNDAEVWQTVLNEKDFSNTPFAFSFGGTENF